MAVGRHRRRLSAHIYVVNFEVARVRRCGLEGRHVHPRFQSICITVTSEAGGAAGDSAVVDLLEDFGGSEESWSRGSEDCASSCIAERWSIEREREKERASCVSPYE